MTIRIYVINQELRLATPFKTLIDGTQEFIKFKFLLDNAWAEITTFAQFTQNDVAYNVYLDEDNCVYLPPEINTGTFTLMLYGTGDNTIGTSNYLTIKMDDNNFINNAQSTEITESLYTQLVNSVNNVNNNLNTITTARTSDVGKYLKVKSVNNGKVSAWEFDTNGGSGEGGSGQDGQDGYSPTITVTNITGGHRVSITDVDGTKTFDVMDGANGTNGVSPTIVVTNITNGHRVSITDTTGTKTFDVMNGSGSGDGSSISIDDTLMISGAAADAKVVGNKLNLIKEDFNVLDSRIDVLEDGVTTTLLGDTPITLTEDTDVRLISAEQSEYILSGFFLADYNSNDEEAEVRLNNTTLTKEGGKMIFAATSEDINTCFADLRLNNLTVGDTYTFTVTRGEYISGTTGGYFIIYDRNGEELARTGDISQDVVTVSFVATTPFARVRLQPTRNYYYETYGITTTTIVNAVVSSQRSNTFNGSVNLGTLESGITISSTPTCQVYSLTKDADTGSWLAGKVCVVLGDSVAAFRTPPEDIPSIIAQRTGMTVYNCAFGGCRISDNTIAEGDTDPWEAFCFVRLTDSIVSGDWSYQEANIDTLQELDYEGYSPEDHFETIKSVNWNNVDILVIFFAGNDAGNVRFDNAQDDDDTYYYLGAFRYCIRKILTAYPHLKLLVVGTDYHKTNNSNTDDITYTIDGQTYHYYDWSDRLMEECKNFHIPTLDWYRSNGLNSLTVDYYMTSDGKHPNYIGNQLLGNQIANRLLSIY